MRYITITLESGLRYVASFAAHMNYRLPDLCASTDSEALHEALCLIDPGKNYSVSFSSAKPRNTKNTFPLV